MSIFSETVRNYNNILSITFCNNNGMIKCNNGNKYIYISYFKFDSTEVDRSEKYK